MKEKQGLGTASEPERAGGEEGCCPYQPPDDPTYRCGRPPKWGGSCIFHCQKRERRKDHVIAEIQRLHLVEEFWKEFEQLLEKLQTDDGVRECDFRGFQFPESFLGLAFQKPVNFCWAVFAEVASFKATEFSESVDFSHSRFQALAEFQSVSFKGDLRLCNAVFSGAVFFRDTVFEGSSVFSKSIFTLGAHFDNVEFCGTVQFQEITAAERLEFLVSRFRTGVDFSGAQLGGKLDWIDVNCEGEANFEDAVFDGGAAFINVVFDCDARFSRAVLKAGVSFFENRFEGIADFTAVEMARLVHFHNECERRPFRAGLYMRRLRIGHEAEVIMERVNLDGASFLDSNIERVNFRDVRWHQTRRGAFFFGRGRRALCDEFVCLEFEKVAENYRQLVLNYERKRDYEGAEDFHVGEMEMRRRGIGSGTTSRWRGFVREWCNGYACYRILSGYGTNYWQALLVLLLMVVGLSGAFLLCGFVEGSGEQKRVIEYELVPDQEHRPTPIGALIGDYAHSTLFTLSILAFRSSGFYEPLGGWSLLLGYITRVMLSGQIALVLFAIRRRFRR